MMQTFVRPNFFAGQLLTEDDLQALTGYVTGKDRLHNRLLFGPGVVCGLDVACDPCGGGTVTVRPGYALDCCGNDIVVGCPERVDVNALVHDLRVRSLGADCGDPCAGDPGGPREYGLYVRYAEDRIEPLTPFPTADSCEPDGCTPSRIRETFTFVVKCPPPAGQAASHRYDPATSLAACLGDAGALTGIRARERRLRRYRAPMRGAVRAAGTTVLFDEATAGRFKASAKDLADVVAGLGDQPAAAAVRTAVELVRALASALVRYDLYDAAGQEELRTRFGLDVDGARTTLGDAYGKLHDRVTDAVWPDPLRRALAGATLEATKALVVDKSTVDAPLEARLLAQGAPLTYPLRAELFADLGRLRQWLLVRLDAGGDRTDCGIRPAVGQVTLPPALPAQPPPGREHATATEVDQAASAAGGLGSALLRYVADCACASIHPSCEECTDGDVLLARVEVRDCTVERICTAEREQVLPGGSGYAAWAPKLYRARALAESVCCQPVTGEPPAPGPADPQAPVALPYLPDLMGEHADRTDLDELLDLLSTPGPGDTAVVTELADLRAQVDALTAIVAGLGKPAAAAEPEPAAPAAPAAAEEEPDAEPDDETAPARKAAPHKATKSARPAKSQPGNRES